MEIIAIEPAQLFVDMLSVPPDDVIDVHLNVDGNYITALGMYDVISTFTGPNTVNVHYYVSGSWLAILVLSAVEPENRFIGKRTGAFFHDTGTGGTGSYTDLKVTRDAVMEIHDRVIRLTAQNYESLSEEGLVELVNRRAIYTTDDLRRLGLTVTE